MQNPTKQHEFIQKLGCADNVKHMTARRDRLVVHMSDEESAIVAVAAIPSSLKICAKVIKSEHFGIVKMDTEFDVSQIPGLVDSVRGARRFGNSRVVQLKFSSKEALDLAIKYGVKIEYCLFRVTMPIEMPKQCHNCQGFGHLAHDCTGPIKCSKCAGNHSIRDQVCLAQTIKCANCRGEPPE